MENFKFLLSKIESSESFRKFKEKNKDAFLCAGFFVIDYESGKGVVQRQIDYCLSDDIYTFMLEKEVSVKKAETIEGQKISLSELNKNIKVDLEEAERILEEKIKQESIPEKLLKVIAVLQVHKGNQIWNLNCVLAGMQILRVHINSENGEILLFEKKSMMDFVKKVK